MKMGTSLTAILVGAAAAISSASAQEATVMAEAIDHASLTVVDARMPVSKRFGSCYRRGAKGDHEVTVRYDVKPNGDVTNVSAVNSTDPCFERYARSAVRKWNYAPVVMNGEEVGIEGMETTISFSKPKRAEDSLLNF